MGKFLFSLLAALALAVPCVAQNAGPGGSGPAQRAIDFYKANTNIQSALYNGIEHTGYPDFYQGTAYFGTSGWLKGDVFYDGVLYRGVNLKFDLVKDELIIQHYDSVHAITAFGPRVGYFTLGDKKFIYLHTDAGAPSGFYEELQTGRAGLIARKTKIISENVTSSGVIKSFEATNSYYLIREDYYYPLRNEASLFELLPDKKKELKQRLKEKGLKYRKAPEATLTEMIAYYNLLTK
jgi:hypothetical protein